MLKFEDLLVDEDQVKNDHIIVTYNIASRKGAKKVAWDIALGQSVGNPEVRNDWETPELFQKHACKLVRIPQPKNSFYTTVDPFPDHTSVIKIAFPAINIDWTGDGIAQLLCHIMGGQVDIDHITRCRAVDIQIPDSVKDYFLEPKIGMSGLRRLTNNYNKPLLGGIMKPKTGLSPDQMLDMTKQLVDGGVDFIKEDEILSNPAFCPLQKRIDLIANYQAKTNNKFIYAFCINCDPYDIAHRVRMIFDGGGNGVHINIWSGLGAYNTIRQLDLPIFIHYQKSGDRVITDLENAFGISWLVLVKLAALCGVDSIHNGMFGGYLDSDYEELVKTMEVLNSSNVIPALSCGMHPGLVDRIRATFGDDWMANVGGAIHGHPDGTRSGAAAMRQAIDKKYGQEYGVAVNKWGIK